jgi:uncharacterized NAD(P)/FAD-binding protein YdhS
MTDSLRRVVIIGGGASGVLLACHLLREPTTNLRVTLIEKRSDVGRGIAYSTANPKHLLNVRAANMSAFPNEPDHFWNWVSVRQMKVGDVPGCADPFCFLPRQVYGDYIASLLTPLLTDGAMGPRLTIIRGECVAIERNAADVIVGLSDGRSCDADYVVLATGHEPPAPSREHYVNPWTPPTVAGIGRTDPILILGTGLTMVDYVLSLVLAGHRGPITALSRRGLLPRAHRPVTALKIAPENVPAGKGVAEVLRWIRRLADDRIRQGGNWREVIDGMRPFNQRLWQGFSLAERRRFLEHARAWWDVHRHRMAPEVERQINATIASGQLTIIAGKLRAVDPNGNGVRVQYRRRGTDIVDTLYARKIVECMALVAIPPDTGNPVLRSLLDRGLVRPDALGIGIDVAPDGAVIDRAGRPAERLFAVGPLTRAAFWEITAVPDIRTQCAALAALIVGRAGAGPQRLRSATTA